MNETTLQPLDQHPVQPYAGFGKRLYAYLIDQSLIQMAAGAGVYFYSADAIKKMWDSYLSIVNGGGAQMLSGGDMAVPTDALESAQALLTFVIIFTALSFVIGLIYGTLFEASSSGATPGKRYCGLRVTTEEGGRVPYVTAFLRNLGINLLNVLLAIDMTVSLLVMPLYLTPLILKKRQTFYDLPLGVIVVKTGK